MRANLMSGIWVHTAKTPLLNNREIRLIIIADKSITQTSALYQSHNSRKSGTDLGINRNQIAPKQSGRITSLVVKSRDGYQGPQKKEVRTLPLKKEDVGEKRGDPENKLTPEQAPKKLLSHQGERGKDRDLDILSNPSLDHQMKPGKEMLPSQNPQKDAEEFSSSPTNESESIEQKDQDGAAYDNSGDANTLLNLNPSPVFPNPVPLLPSGRYAEYSEKLARRETVYSRKKNDSMLEQSIQRMLPQEVGPNSLLKTNATCLIGMIITILLMFMFLILR
jgi:hypothetical protein